jgi:hypothetical protein
LIDKFLAVSKVGVALFLPTNHSNFAVTHPTMIKALKIDEEKVIRIF